MKKIVLACAIALLVLGSQAEAQLINFDLSGNAGAGLLTGNENQTVSTTTASGDSLGIVFNTVTNELDINVGWGSGNGFGDLTGSATGMHIHGPADVNTNAGVLIGLTGLAGFNSSATNGGFNGTVTLTAGQATTLLNGETYLNVHTAANGGGEIRGNLFAAVPEPSSLAVLGLLTAVGFGRRRRSC